MKNKKVYLAKSEAEMWGYIKGKHIEQAARGHFVYSNKVTSNQK